nr:hypothetical protein Iba_chr12dCG10610 [Ipomoea batatas]
MSTQCQILMKMKPFSSVAAYLTRAFFPTCCVGGNRPSTWSAKSLR